jgi:uncharacterized protein (DUF924 family)
MNRSLACLLPLLVILSACATGSPNPAATQQIESPAPSAVAVASLEGQELERSRESWLSRTDPEAMAILRFWYEEWDQDRLDGGRGRYNDKWFPHGPAGAASSKEVDREIRERFLLTFEAATEGRLDWDIDSNPYESLAYILLIDQFSRNMFRGEERAYAHDALAREAARHNIEQGFHRYYFTGYQRLFLVYPLMHHEDLGSQTLSLELLKAINEHPGHRYAFLNAFDKGMEHYQMILMFGRFPHRNVRLERADTELESAYLSKQGTKGFVDGSKW